MKREMERERERERERGREREKAPSAQCRCGAASAGSLTARAPPAGTPRCTCASPHALRGVQKFGGGVQGEFRGVGGWDEGGFRAGDLLP